MEPTQQRDRALRRLSLLTKSAGVAGFAATVGFGGLAAATYRGHTPTTGGTLTPQVPGQSTTSSGTTANGSQVSPTQAPVVGRHRDRQPVSINPPVLTFGGGQMTSGGSG